MTLPTNEQQDDRHNALDCGHGCRSVGLNAALLIGHIDWWAICPPVPVVMLKLAEVLRCVLRRALPNGHNDACNGHSKSAQDRRARDSPRKPNPVADIPLSLRKSRRRARNAIPPTLETLFACHQTRSRTFSKTLLRVEMFLHFHNSSLSNCKFQTNINETIIMTYPPISPRYRVS